MTLRDELSAVWDAYAAAYRAGDAEGCAAVFAAGAVLISPFGPTATGRAAIAATHAEWLREGGEGKTIEIVDCGGEGALAWCLARFAEGDGTGAGVSLVVLERDGADWRIRLCSLNEADAPRA
jgi:uncharacterized protein (TIGR02246 family)